MGVITEKAGVGAHAEAGLAPASAAAMVRHDPFCQGLSNTDVLRIKSLATVLSVAPGDRLCVEAKPALHAFYVTEGVIKLYKSLSDGRRQISRFLYAGDFLGVPDSAKRYRSTARAVTTVEVWRFERRAFAKLLRSSRKLEASVRAIVWQEIEDAREHMMLLARKSAEQRIASFLLSLRHRPAVPCAVEQCGEEIVALPMTRRDMADYVGLEIETVSRTLNALKRRGVIALPHVSCVRVLSAHDLESLAGAPGPEGGR